MATPGVEYNGMPAPRKPVCCLSHRTGPHMSPTCSHSCRCLAEKTAITTLPTASECATFRHFRRQVHEDYQTQKPAGHLVLFQSTTVLPADHLSWPTLRTPADSFPSQDCCRHEMQMRACDLSRITSTVCKEKRSACRTCCATALTRAQVRVSINATQQNSINAVNVRREAVFHVKPDVPISSVISVSCAGAML